MLGIGVGVIIASITPVFANIQEYLLVKVEYPIIVNGAEYKDEELPALNLNGSTYVPLRNVGNILESNVQWNDELCRVEIGEVVEVKPFTNIPYPEDVEFSEERANNGKPIYAIYHNTKYYHIRFFEMSIGDRGYRLIWSDSTQTGVIKKGEIDTVLYEIAKDDYISIRHGYGNYINQEIVKSLFN